MSGTTFRRGCNAFTALACFVAAIQARRGVGAGHDHPLGWAIWLVVVGAINLFAATRP